MLPGLILPHGLYPRGFFATDFREYANGSPPGDWTKQGATTTETWSISADAASVGGRILTVTPAAANTGLRFDRLGSAITDGDAVCILKTGASTAATHYNMGIIFRGQAASDAGYSFALSNTGSSLIEIDNIGVGALASTAFTWSANTRYALRARIQGTTLSVKAWAWPGPESGATSTSVVAANFASGYVGAMSFTNAIGAQGSIDYFAFAPGTGVAPLPQG